ncbi:uncharacterized protein SETTUDRAFT_141583 [Exserohilum turcica Et28A]|uniref:NADH:flavin oxidoreductase/NADH oxidase N-terminal domain-containing protein n=1 Tax=Exserohilum turcicum (strain 28A) TaxID=671987 RepID=R0I8V4_EXST2|nr:uncharacterized protein SETTUDRAFT_141583 [Exserohilum turcica Et28A]EOA81831.1 hypothetical protein SETTUDRAFT_141583 [Exserohilum turcica Et28A]
MAPKDYNHGVPGLPYFTPKHLTSPGSIVPNSKQHVPVPTLFTPLTIRGTTLRNRILVAPMCQYSTASEGPSVGALTDYHIATLGHYALKGASLVMVEATGVQPNGRITPNCPGLWTDAQIPALRRVSDFIKSQGALSGLQLAHAGRKASTSELERLVQDWAEAAQRGVKAGVDMIEIHAAHGYLIHEFLSPVTNQRTDKYGGSFENRTRLLIEIIKAIRAVIPDTMPLYLRISATDWLEETELGKKYGSWDVESSIRLAKLLPVLGVDLLDVSSGGNHPEQRISTYDSKDYQTKIAAQIRRELKKENLNMFIGAVGLIIAAEQARDIVEDGAALSKNSIAELASEAQAAVKLTEGKEPLADVVLVGRQFMREPEWVLRVAWQLGLDVGWSNQFLRVRFPKL